MFSVRNRLLGVLNNIVKAKLRIHVDEVPYYRTVISTPNILISKALFSNDTSSNEKEPVKGSTPLYKLISKNVSQLSKEITQPANEQEDEEETKRARESAWRTMKYTLIFFGVTITFTGGYLIFTLGQPKIGEDGKLIEDAFSNMSTVKQYLFRTYSEVDYYKRLFKEPSREKLLPDVVTYPYYQPPYTLILEMTDVLVHPDWTYKTGWRFKKRPGIEQFLESLCGTYEIVVYTAEQGLTVFPIIEALDPKNHISYKLVRDATHFVDGHHVKNLDKLNRDLSKVIVVDWNLKSVKFHPDNVFKINRWTGADNDTALLDLATFLRAIADSEIEDVRDVLKNYSSYDDPLAAFVEKHKMLVEQQEAERELLKNQSPNPIKRWAPSFLKNRIM